MPEFASLGSYAEAFCITFGFVDVVDPDLIMDWYVKLEACPSERQKAPIIVTSKVPDATSVVASPHTKPQPGGVDKGLQSMCAMRFNAR